MRKPSLALLVTVKPVISQYRITLSWPGQHVDYLHMRSEHIKTAAEPTQLWRGSAKELSDEDIDDLSAYFSSQSGDLR